MLGPFGQVSALDNAKQLVLSDFAGNLRYIIKVLKVAQGSQNLPIYIYVCRNIGPREAVAAVQKLICEQQKAKSSGPTADAKAGASSHPAIGKIQDPQSQVNSELSLNVVANSDVLVLRGRASAVAEAKALLRMIDSEPSNPHDTAKNKTNQEVFVLKSLRVRGTQQTLKGMLEGSLDGAPQIEVDVARHALIVKGNRTQITNVRLILRALGENNTENKKKPNP